MKLFRFNKPVSLEKKDNTEEIWLNVTTTVTSMYGTASKETWKAEIMEGDKPINPGSLQVPTCYFGTTHNEAISLGKQGVKRILKRRTHLAHQPEKIVVVP